MRAVPLRDPASALEMLVGTDAVGQLVARAGRMAELCTDGATLKMDWVDEAQELLSDNDLLSELEKLAASWHRRGVRHVIWSGMGGSGVIVGALTALRMVGGRRCPVQIHPLDSTDPLALERVVANIRAAKGLDARPTARSPRELRALLDDVALVAVSFGMTSEEPAGHLAWFLGLLDIAGLAPSRHVHVLTVPGSMLDEVANRHGVHRSPVWLGSRSGFPGRMSAPATRVFLFPLALASCGGDTYRGGYLAHVLRESWAAYNLAGAAAEPMRSEWVRLAAALFDRAEQGCCKVALELPESWQPLHAWIEQLLEQTLGKRGRGVVVFAPQTLKPAAPGFGQRLVVAAAAGDRGALPLPNITRAAARPASVGVALLGWQLTAALVGYLNETNIVDEPAVEDYKARARALRSEPKSLERAIEAAMVTSDKIEAIAETLIERAAAGGLAYLDVTLNGELSEEQWRRSRSLARRLANTLLGVPVKVRRAPAAYHVSEQCQLDGPGDLASLRFVARQVRSAAIGEYTGLFLQAQAVATVEAMVAGGRHCALIAVDDLDRTPTVLAQISAAVEARAQQGPPA